MKSRILLVDDNRAFRLSTSALLQDRYEVVGAADGEEAVEKLDDRFDLVVMDVRMPGIQGVDLVEVLRRRGEGVPILMISGFGTVDTAVRALQVGADDFLTKPVEPDLLRDRIARLIRDRPRPRVPEGRRLIGRTPAIEAVVRDIDQVAPSDATVLITGETGTGKELVARAIHERSTRADAAFVAVNSAGLAEGLIESQLFGHVRGAFTGADRDRPGLFEAADGGSIFLDEVGDMSPSSQKRLLRVLQDGEVLPVGAVEPRRVDVRVIAATHRKLSAAVENERFRADLYYRLNVFHIELPPLRNRLDDVPLLIEHYLDRVGAQSGPNLSPRVLERFLKFDWPGNVRQLFSVLESARIRADGGAIHMQHLPPEFRESPGRESPRYSGPENEDAERTAIEEALRQCDGHRAEAARLLGMGRTTLWRRMREYGMDDESDD